MCPSCQRNSMRSISEGRPLGAVVHHLGRSPHSRVCGSGLSNSAPRPESCQCPARVLGPRPCRGDPHLNSWLWPSSWSNLSCCVRLGSEPTARSVFMWKVKKWRSWVKSMEKGIKSLSVVQNHLKIHTYFCYMHFLPSSRTPWLRV